MAFPQAGLQLVVRGMNTFAADLRTAGQGVMNFARSVERSSESFNVFQSAASRAGREFTIFARALTYVAIYKAIDVMGELTQSIYTQAAAYDILVTSLEAMIARDQARAGMAESAADAMAKNGEAIKQQAAETAEWTVQLGIASRYSSAQLQAVYSLGATYGFTQEQLKPLVGIMTDWGSATGRSSDDMEGAIRAFGQIAAKGSVAGQELKQLADHGVPALEYLAQGFDVSQAKMKEMVKEGAVPAAIALQMITDAMAKDYQGATARFAQSIVGLTTSLEDLVNVNIREFGLGIADGILPYIAELVTWLNNPAIREGARNLGEQVGEAAGNFFAWAGAIMSTEDPLRTLAYLADQAVPGIGHLFDTLRETIPIFLELASAAFEYGAAIVSNLASGMLAAAAEVLDALSYVAGIINYWLAPGSPPRILPDLDVWGMEWIETLVGGFKSADLSGILDLQKSLQAAFSNLVPTGAMDSAGVIPAVLGTTEGVAQAVDDLNNLGYVSQGVMTQIRASAGDAGEEVVGLIESYAALVGASNQLAKAQVELNTITQHYDNILDPLIAKQKALENAQTGAQEEKDLAKWRLIAASNAYSAATKAKAQREIEKIELARQIRQTQAERDTAVAAAEAKVKAGEDAVAIAKQEYETRQAQINFTKEQNDLVREQIALLEKQQEKIKGGGGGGSDVVKQKKDEQKAIEAAAEAEFKLALAKADTAGKIELYKQKLASLTPGTKEYFDTQREIVLLEQQLAREQESAANKAEKLGEKEAKQAEQIRDAQFEAELAGKSHEERLKLLQDRLAQMTPGTKEYYDMLKRVRQEQEALDRENEAKAKREAKGKGKGGGGGADELGGIGGGLGGFKPVWEGLDLKGITDKGEEARKKIEEIRQTIDNLGKTVTDTTAKMMPYKDFFIGLAAVLGGAMLVALGSWIAGIISAAAPVLALAAAIGFLKLAWDTNLGGMKDKLIEAWNGAIKPALDMLGQALSMWLPEDINTLADAWEKVLKPALMAVWQFIVDYVIPALAGIAAGLIIVIAGAIAGFKVVWEGLRQAFKTVSDFVSNTLMPAFLGIKKFLDTDSRIFGDIFLGVMQQMVIQPIKDAWKWVQDLWDRLVKFALYLTAGLVVAFTTARDYINDNFITPIKDGYEATLELKTRLENLAASMIGELANKFDKFKSDYIDPITDAFEDAYRSVDDMLSKVTGLVDYLSSVTIPMLDIDINWPDPPDWYCDLFGCSPKPPPMHQTVFVDPVFTPPTAMRYSAPVMAGQTAAMGVASASANNVTNNYNYSPTYGGGPRNDPRRSFDIMRTWGM